MTKIKIKSMRFQRNGVHGSPFYHALISYKEQATIAVNNMLVTFQTNDDKEINIQSCRAVDIDNLSEAWRGDIIANDLQRYFNAEIKAKGGTIYDCCTKELYTV